MNLINLVKVGVACAALIFSYWMGVQQGRESEELKNARLEIHVLKSKIQGFRLKQTNDAVALSELRIAESAHRNELSRMRSQLAEIERLSKTNTDRERNRCLRVAVRYKEAVDRADRAIKFCAENHK